MISLRLALLLLGSLVLPECQAFGVPLPTNPRLSAIAKSTTTTAIRAGGDGEEKPFAVVVKALVDPDRMAEFLKLIENNAIESRKEPGCLRFDVLRSQDTPNEFFFYELYTGMGAIDHHKQQKHYQAWADFKESGGTLSSVTFKTDGEFLP